MHKILIKNKKIGPIDASQQGQIDASQQGPVSAYRETSESPVYSDSDLAAEWEKTELEQEMLGYLSPPQSSADGDRLSDSRGDRPANSSVTPRVSVC
jgi:hypothetical protein